MPYVINTIAAMMCSTPVVALCACIWWLFKDPDVHVELTPRAHDVIATHMQHVHTCIPYTDVVDAFNALKGQSVALVRIKGSKVTISPPHNHRMVEIESQQNAHLLSIVLNKYAKHLKDNLFIWVLCDQSERVKLPKHYRHVPLVVHSLNTKTQYEYQPLLNVDASTVKKWPYLFHGITRNIKPVDQKRHALFWRGSLSDMHTSHLASMTPRRQLVEWSTQYPQYINARFVKVRHTDPETLKTLMIMYPKCSYVGEIDHLPFRYQITIDGSACSGQGFIWRLASGCITLKQDSPYVQWFHTWVQPHEHYVPIKADLSDLLSYLESHADDGAIAVKARRLVEQELTPNHVLGYFVTLLNRLSEHTHPTCKRGVPCCMMESKICRAKTQPSA